MANWDPAQSIIRLIDKTNDVPTGIDVAGFLVDGDIIATNLMARLVIDEAEGRIPNAILYLNINRDNRFITTAPILNDKNASNLYLLEVKIAQIIGGVTYFTKLQRFRLSNAAIVEDKDLGQVLQIPCENIAYQLLRENNTSLNEELVNPHDRAEHIIAAYQSNPGDDGVRFGTVDNTLPEKDSLRQDYVISSPIPLGDSFDDIIERVKEAGPLGGFFRNFFYAVEADPNDTRVVNITLQEFGEVNSGVTITSTAFDAALLDRTGITSDKKRKNQIIVRYHPRGGSLPMAHTRFASRFIHAKFRPEWQSGNPYLEGDLVKYTHTTTTPYTIRFFQALNDVTSATTPDADSANWYEDFVIIPLFNSQAIYTVGEIVVVNDAGTIKHFQCTAQVGPGSLSPPLDGAHWAAVFTNRPEATRATFETYTPYTTDVEAWKSNLADYTSPPSGYVGFAVDWNYERQINDLKDYTNRYQMVTGKAVRDVLNSPPTGRNLFRGSRYLVGSSPTGAWAGMANRIAEYVLQDFVGQTPTGWQFSDAPVTGDTIFLLTPTQATIAKWSGAAWTNVWTSAVPGKPSCFHAVKDIRRCKSATGIPAQAIECRFDWKDASAGGNDLNQTARGAWLSFFYPYPRFDVASKNIGGYYGGDNTNAPTNPMVNHQNLNRTSTGKFGWNHGAESEDLGRLPAHSFKIRLGFFKSADDSSLFYGKGNMAMVYWRKDENGRFFFKDFIVPENYEWYPITIPLPPFGPTNLYFNRLNELVEVFGYTLPYDFFIKEKEFAGVQYEWKRNQSWGVFLKETYNQVGMYQGNYQTFFDRVGQALSQIIPTTIKGIEYVATGNWSALQSLFTSGELVDHTWIGIDELHYSKEGYAIYPQTEVDEPRAETIPLQQETDYLTSLAKAEATYIEDQFFPNERYVNATGDVRIRYGQLITETGPRVPGGSLQSVVAQNKITIDSKGINHELYLIRKFVIS